MNRLMTMSFPVGLTMDTTKGHIARATLEASCFQSRAILEAMEQDSGHKLTELAVDGGMAASDIAMQVWVPFLILFIADKH